SPRVARHLRKRRIAHRGDRAPIAHGLGDTETKGLKGGVEYEHVAGPEIRSELFPRDVSDEMNLLVNSQLAGQSPKPRFLRPFSSQHQRSRSFPVKVVPHRAQHDVHALLRSETLEGKEQRRTCRDVQGAPDGGAVTGRGRDLDAVVDNLTPRA